MFTMYGIPNCDTVKKAKKHLEGKGFEVEFFNFKKEAPTKVMIKRWKEFVGELPVNPKGRIYKQMKEEYDNATAATKVTMLQENTSLIKRPVLERDGEVLCLGYDKDLYENL